MNTVVKTLQQKDTVQFLQQQGIVHFSIVGSYANNTASYDSDVDLVYESAKETGWEIFDVTFFLEKKLGKKVDMINKKYLRTSIAQSVLADKIDIL